MFANFSRIHQNRQNDRAANKRFRLHEELIFQWKVSILEMSVEQSSSSMSFEGHHEGQWGSHQNDWYSQSSKAHSYEVAQWDIFFCQIIAIVVWIRWWFVFRNFLLILTIRSRLLVVNDYKLLMKILND